MDTHTLYKLAQITLDFGHVKRATWDWYGRPETDTTHTVMLGLFCLHLLPEINERRRSGEHLSVLSTLMYALVHDLPEVYAGDVNTAGGLTPDQQIAKNKAELRAFRQLETNLPSSFVVDILHGYMAQDSAEAQFVRYLDKILPKIVRRGGPASHILRGYGDLSDMKRAHADQIERLRLECPLVWETLEPLLRRVCDGLEEAADSDYVREEAASLTVTDMVKRDLDQRTAAGIQKYGRPLTTRNGRSAIVDAYQEVLDLAQYLRQHIEEQGLDPRDPTFCKKV